MDYKFKFLTSGFNANSEAVLRDHNYITVIERVEKIMRMEPHMNT
jgi:hypothetical protein